MAISLNIYDENMEKVERTVVAEKSKIGFGAVRKLTKMMNYSKIEDKVDAFKILADGFSEIIKVLDGFFPDVTEEEWDRVMPSELLTNMGEIVQFAVSNMLEIPTESKNQ